MRQVVFSHSLFPTTSPAGVPACNDARGSRHRPFTNTPFLNMRSVVHEDLCRTLLIIIAVVIVIIIDIDIIIVLITMIIIKAYLLLFFLILPGDITRNVEHEDFC